eukprot:357930-Chlamydomonas_euryale.AAC.5
MAAAAAAAAAVPVAANAAAPVPRAWPRSRLRILALRIAANPPASNSRLYETHLPQNTPAPPRVRPCRRCRTRAPGTYAPQAQWTRRRQRARVSDKGRRGLREGQGGQAGGGGRPRADRAARRSPARHSPRSQSAARCARWSNWG